MLKTGLLVSVITVLFDQLTKWLIRDFVLLSIRKIEVTQFFNIVEVWNQGVSFGLLAINSPWTPYLLSALALVIVTILIFWLRKAETRFLGVALGFIIGGAVGNVIDRMIWGQVFDFLDFHIASYHWPAFNVADSAIFMGVALILADGFIAKRPKQS
ncbi:MAG: Lipoprotein signal peptidase [Alphaproteobacteria bacterium MarineAlpha4_Bin2]|nr:MAG: Lipoprotein signal peptidase [Alphaproteobacteria bacterium MarineAlpha4_Bin2]|tara:strand:+ start:1342 stop:1812 length:471 start_codon:yes stop_codon:yes gene_type:complete